MSIEEMRLWRITIDEYVIEIIEDGNGPTCKNVYIRNGKHVHVIPDYGAWAETADYEMIKTDYILVEHLNRNGIMDIIILYYYIPPDYSKVVLEIEIFRNIHCWMLILRELRDIKEKPDLHFQTELPFPQE